MIHSIFNEVLGPITTGPSSSHTAGCGRIGLTARSLFGRPVKRAEIVFEEKGSYPSTYVGQGSDYGFTGGLLGIPIDDPQFRNALQIAKEQGVEIVFKSADLGYEHPNQAEIRLYADEAQLRLMTFSTGGGMIEIRSMDGVGVMIDGSTTQVFILCAEELKEEIEDMLQKHRFLYDRMDHKGELFYDIAVNAEQDSAPLEALRGLEGVRYVRVSRPVMAVPRRRMALMPFTNAAGALEYAKEHGLDAAQLAVCYESAYGYVNEEQVMQLAARIEEVMRASSVPPDPAQAEMHGFLPYQGQKMREALDQMRASGSPLIGGEVFEEAVLASVAVMENSNAHNVVAAAPTAGASGVLPGAIVAAGSKMGYSSEKIREGILVAGLVGAFIANQATFGAEVAGCQAENGSASAMAAAGLAHMMGCGPEAVFRAASMALQNTLGLVCDPIAGLTEVPCITRNAAAMAGAIASADLARLGFDSMIPLDEAILAMKDVGEQLPAELRCTCKVGLCATKTGQRLQTWMNGMREDRS
ncbi:MAG: L-serine ammonia-lyase, iron-sulfur-dependent, subunit alpha [Firmicutes bacterium]|nr:L-serine ammonia-lyase, iron-sulfur-dependent, subunit alpha [Bacillota bacterium]